MSAFKKFLHKRKKKKSSSGSIQSATSEPNLSDVGPIPGYQNVKEKDLPKLHKAAWLGDMTKLKQLVKKGDVNSMDKHHRTPLHYACVRGNSEIAQWMCANRANLGICDEDGRTALMKAVECASERCTEILLNHGAETNVVDVNLTTPLHIVATHGSIPIATMLLERDARINAPDTDKITPLYVAASLGFPDFVDFLLQEYALVNEPDDYGRTPLIAASMEGHTEVVKVLLKFGADTEVKDKEGWKATDHAAMAGHQSTSALIDEYVGRQQDEAKAVTQEAASNFGSGIGSPFRSTSTQPASSTFGGPAINITADSEDESFENDSPRRSEFQDSWADSESEQDQLPKAVPNLTEALKRTSEPSSKIPIASSKEKFTRADEIEAQKKAAHTESKIPKLESGIPQLKTASSKEAISSHQSSIPKMQSKIPTSKGAGATSLSPTHSISDHQVGPQIAGLESRIPRLSKSNSSVSRENIPRIGNTSNVSSPAKSPIQNDRRDSLGWEKADFSDFDSDSEAFSDTDVLAALHGSPTMKVPSKGKIKAGRMDSSDPLEENTLTSVEGAADQAIKIEAAEATEKPLVTENQTKESPKEDGDTKKDEEEPEVPDAENSVWDSTTEEVTPPKPALSDILKKKEETGDAKMKEKFDLGSDLDVSDQTVEFSSPELAKKPQKTAGAEPPRKEEKGDGESEFSDFSFNETQDEIERVLVEGSKDQEVDKLNVVEKDKGKRKDSKDLKNQMEALGLDFGSSISSFSESENIGELDLSITKHDAMFSPTKPSDKKPTDSPENKVDTTEDRPQDTNKNVVDSSMEAKIEPTEKVDNEEQKITEKKGAKSSKEQYDALGIDFSESESALETESEWEISLKNKKLEDKPNEEEGMDEIVKESEGESDLWEKRSQIVEQVEPSEGSVTEGNETEDGEKGGSKKRDSEFVSDESFSLDTEDQLEELEESRIKKAEEVDKEDEIEDELAKDFNDSDFSLTESSKNESKLEETDDSRLKDQNESESEVIEKDAEGGSIDSEADMSKESTAEKMQQEDGAIGKVENNAESSVDADASSESAVQHEGANSGEGSIELIKEVESSTSEFENRDTDSSNDIVIEDNVSTESLHGDIKEEPASEPSRVDTERLTALQQMAERMVDEKVEIGGSDPNEDRSRKISDIERRKALEAIARPLNNEAPSKKGPNDDHKRKISDAERKSALEAMVKPMNIEPAQMQNVESGMDFGIAAENEAKLPRGGIKKKELEIIESEGNISDEIEEQFERQMKEKEMEASKKEEESRQFNTDAERRGAEMVKEIEEFEKELKLKEAEQRMLEEQRKKEMELEKQRIKLEIERKIRQHEEDLKEKEKSFEAELKRRENEEKEKRQRQLLEWEKEKQLLEETRKKNLEEEFKRLEEEKKTWERKKQIQNEKLQKELEEASRRRKEEELKAAETEKRVIEQEKLWEKKKRESEMSWKARRDVSDDDDNEKRKALEELLEIENYMKSNEALEQMKVKEELVDESPYPNTGYKAQFKGRDDYITPIKTANDFVENQLELEPLMFSPSSQVSDYAKDQSLMNEEAERKLEETKKMREEAAMMLQAAREKTNALINGDRGGGATKLSPRQRPRAYEEMSDYGSADVDEIIKGNGNFQHHRDDISDMIPTPGSEANDADLRNENRIGSPTTSTPYGRYNTAMPSFHQGDNHSPIHVSKGTSGMGKVAQDRDSSPFKSPTPMALYASLSQTGHFQDSKALMKMQDSLRESKREMERLKDKNSTLESMKREMEADVREMQRTVEILSKSQTDFERHRLDVEMEMRDLRYRLEQEMEAKTGAEGLVSQLKDQIKRGEDKLMAEAEARQTIELAYKTLEAEFKVRENLAGQLESDLNDLKYTLRHERETRFSQEQLYREQLQQHEALLEEAQRTSFQHAQTVSQLEVIDQNRQSAESAANQLKVDLAKAKGELTRVTAQLEEVKSTYESEVSRLRNKLQEKSDELVKSEREQFQVQMHLEAEKSTAKAEQLRLTASFENEIANKKRLETEINVLKAQLQNASKELERLSKTKSLTESEVSKVKEESFKDRNKQDRELASAKEETQRILAKLDASERQCDILESELQSAKISLAEKSGQLVMSARDAEYRGNLLNQMEEKLRHEKEINNRLSSKVDGGSERTSILQREIDNLRRELETANQRTSDCDRAARDAQEKFQHLLSKAKEDFEKERSNFEQRILQLNEANLRFREDHTEDKEDIKNKDNEIRLIEKEMNELARRLSAAEAAKEIQTKANEQLETEKAKLSRETAVLERKVDELTSSKGELENKLEDLSEQLEHTLKVSDHTNSKLVKKTADAHSALSSRAELEKAMTRLKVEKAELESELREEQAKSEMILDDLRNSNDARESLEKILANLKMSNVHLEEKLQSETLSRAQRERDAEDHKDLWNSEVRSRSKLGLKVVSMEKEIQALKMELEEEKRKTIQVEEMKRSLDSKLDYYDKRSLQHQKEASALKNKLRQYQRRLKDFEHGESRIPKIYNEFEREREVMLNNASNLRRQVDSLSEQLRQEQDSRSQTQIDAKRNDQELTELRAREKVLSYEKTKLERENQLLEDEIDRLKDYYDQNYVNKSNLETFKRDIETKARLEINRKLQDVNIQLEEQAVAREAYDRVRSETESKTKKELEETISDLKNELSYVKSALQDGIVKKSTYETEASRIRELYQNEVAEKLQLSEQFNKLSDQLASSRARSSLEKSRNLTDLSPRGNPTKSARSTFLTAERDDYGPRTGLRQSDLISSSPLPSNPFTASTQRPGAGTRDFWPSFQRNYLM